jgi:hypothetical protein
LGLYKNHLNFIIFEESLKEKRETPALDLAGVLI